MVQPLHELEQLPPLEVEWPLLRELHPQGVLVLLGV